MQIRTLLFLLLILALTSCEKTFEIPIPEESNKPVLNLLMSKDSLLTARVTLSTRIQSTQPIQEVKDAVVNLYENENFKETLIPYLSGQRTYYRSSTVPQEGATYKVTAAVAGYKEVSGSDMIPDTVATGEMKLTIVKVDTWQSKITVNVQIHDNPAVQNYYRIRMYQLLEWVDANGNPGRQKLPLYFESETSGLPLLDETSRPEFYTTDALFNGRSPRFTFKTDSYIEAKKVVVEITSLTYHSYNYLNSSFLAWEKNDNVLSEKVIVYNNIINGLGIVGGIAQREYELK